MSPASNGPKEGETPESTVADAAAPVEDDFRSFLDGLKWDGFFGWAWGMSWYFMIFFHATHFLGKSKLMLKRMEHWGISLILLHCFGWYYNWPASKKGTNIFPSSRIKRPSIPLCLFGGKEMDSKMEEKKNGDERPQMVSW